MAQAHALRAKDEALMTHYHNFDENFLCTKGRAVFSIEGETFELDPGQSIHIPAHRYHECKFVGETSGYVTWLDFYKINEPLFFVTKESIAV